MSTSPQDDLPRHAHGAAPHRVGTEGLWFFVFIDMLIFALIFLVYMLERGGSMASYAASQAALDPWFGLFNTLLLLTSSWMVAEAVQASRLSDAVRVRRRLLFALLLGAAFCISKFVEYGTKFEAGIGPATNPFFSFYFFITFVHFMHVLAGMIFINSFRARSAQCDTVPRYTTGLENTGLFWHYVDILWIFIFPLLYLL